MRIGINIPDELMRRLEPLKPELNISQVCREALEAKAESYELMLRMMDDESTKTAVDLVWGQEQQHRQALEIDWEILGYEDAKSWANAATWEDWEYRNRRRDSVWMHGRRRKDASNAQATSLGEPKTFFDRERDLMDYIVKQDPEFMEWFESDFGGFKQIDFPGGERKYSLAWLAYTDAVWELIKQRQLEHSQRMSAQRAAPPEPKVSERLFGDTRPQVEQSFQVVPHHSRLADGVDSLKLNRLIDQSDVQEILPNEEKSQ